MDIERDQHCSFDQLTVYDGEDSNGAHIATYCHDSPPEKTDFSTNNVVFMTFVSDSSVSGVGFTVRYEAVDPTQGQFEHEPSGNDNTGENPTNISDSKTQVRTYSVHRNCIAYTQQTPVEAASPSKSFSLLVPSKLRLTKSMLTASG